MNRTPRFILLTLGTAGVLLVVLGFVLVLTSALPFAPRGRRSSAPELPAATRGQSTTGTTSTSPRTASATPTLSPTVVLSPLSATTPTPGTLRLAVGHDVRQRFHSHLAALMERHPRLVIVPCTSTLAVTDDSAMPDAYDAVLSWGPRGERGAILMREEPYVLVAHVLDPSVGLTSEQLKAIVSGADDDYQFVCVQEPAIVEDLLHVDHPPDSAIVAADWLAVKEHVATHRGCLGLLPWEEVDFRVQAVAVDERGYDPRQATGHTLFRRLWLTCHRGFPEALVEDLAQALAHHAPPTVELVAVGDVMLASHVGQYMDSHSVRYPFEGRDVQALLSKADIAFGNLECVLSDRGARVSKSYTFRANPAAIEALTFAGFDVLSLANNHTGDYGDIALEDTLDLLSEAGIVAVGAGRTFQEAHRPRIVESNGLRLAFLAYNQIYPRSFAATQTSPGCAFMNPEQMRADVQEAREQSDLVIVSCHWGVEYSAYPNASQRELARVLTAAGVDLVIGHHPHVVQGLSYGAQTFVAYSLGNFVFYHGPTSETAETVIMRCLLDASGVKTIDFMPVAIANCQPSILSSAETGRVTDRIFHVTSQQGSAPRTLH